MRLIREMDLVEKVGSGILRMKDAMKEYGLKGPIIEADENWFSITFERDTYQNPSENKHENKYKNKHINTSVNTPVNTPVNLNQSQKSIIDFLKENPYIERPTS